MSDTDPKDLAAYAEAADAWFRENVVADPGFMLPLTFMEVGTDQQFHFLQDWQHKVWEAGYLGAAWPKAYGGRGLSQAFQNAATRAMRRHNGPIMLNAIGINWTGPLLLDIGSEAHKLKYLKGIVSAEDIWCQGFSEPENGSDLGNAQTRAVRDGDDYVLNGSKIWTTHAHHANRMFCLVRTRFDGKPQQGITFLLLAMTTPGITVKPIITLAGEHEVNQVFFDDVRVPKSGRLGEENKGWTVAKYLLEFERGGGSAPGLKVALGRVRAMAAAEAAGDGGRLIQDGDFRARLAAAEVAIEAIEMTEHRVLADLAGGRNPGPASSMLKTQGTEAMQALDPASPLAEHSRDIRGIYCLTFKVRSAAAAAAHLRGKGFDVVGDPDARFAIAPRSGVRQADLFHRQGGSRLSGAGVTD